jgi:hypothetical protein
MKKTLMLLLSIALFISLIPMNTHAANLNKLPSVQSSRQWSVEIGKAETNQPELIQSKPGVYNVYSMDVKYVGKEEIKIVNIEAYRNEPRTSTEFELFTVKDIRLQQPLFHHSNFPISTKATKLTVILTWSKKSDTSTFPRTYKEQFVFNQ